MIRPATAAELPFIRETCCKVRQPRGSQWSSWLASHGPTVDGWLAEGKAAVYVEDEEPDIVLGFMVTTGDLVRMLYVKRDFRGHGIGLALVGSLPKKPTPWLPNAVWHRWVDHHRRVLAA